MSEQPLLDAMTKLARHWRYPSGDFRYTLNELADTMRVVIKGATDVDIYGDEDDDPEGPHPLPLERHKVVFTQPITDHNTQAVCACGHVMDSYGSTVAQRSATTSDARRS